MIDLFLSFSFNLVWQQKKRIRTKIRIIDLCILISDIYLQFFKIYSMKFIVESIESPSLVDSIFRLQQEFVFEEKMAV